MLSQAKSAAPASIASAIVPAASAIVLGMFVLFGVAFAGPEVLHNAAHNSRHAFAFPCH